MNDQSGEPLDTSMLFDVFALSQAVGRMLADTMRDGPLSPTEYAVYSAVFELEAATPTRLAARLGMRLTTFMDQLHVLEGRGHAVRLDNPGDRRSYRVVLTAPGLDAHRAANRQFEAAQRAFEARLPGGAAGARACLRALRHAAETAATATLEGASPRPRAGRAG